MASNRMQRTNEDIRMAMAAILREVKDPRVQQGMISVTGANATSDLKFCKIYLSVYGLKSEKELMKGVRSASGWLRRELGNRLNLRAVPELSFELDHSIETGAHINEILRTLDISEDPSEPDTSEGGAAGEE